MVGVPVDQPRFQVVARAGVGAHADVLSALEQSSGHLVAIKRLFHKPQDASELQALLTEALLLQQCAGCDHIVELMDAYESTSGRIHLVLEHAGHTLARELTFRPRGLPHALVMKTAWQVLLALEHLHARQVAHGDLKPDNILIDHKRGGLIKLCDLGSATPCRSGPASASEPSSPRALTDGPTLGRASAPPASTPPHRLGPCHPTIQGTAATRASTSNSSSLGHALSGATVCPGGAQAAEVSTPLARTPTRRHAGALWYRPPEVLEAQQGEPQAADISSPTGSQHPSDAGSGNAGATPAGDIWALGAVLCELITGRPLFPGQSPNHQLSLIRDLLHFTPSARGGIEGLEQQGSEGADVKERMTSAAGVAVDEREVHVVQALQQRLGPSTPAELVHLVAGCLNPDPECRPTAAQLLQLPCFSQWRAKAQQPDLHGSHAPAAYTTTGQARCGRGQAKDVAMLPGQRVGVAAQPGSITWSASKAGGAAGMPQLAAPTDAMGAPAVAAQAGVQDSSLAGCQHSSVASRQRFVRALSSAAPCQRFSMLSQVLKALPKSSSTVKGREAGACLQVTATTESCLATTGSTEPGTGPRHRSLLSASPALRPLLDGLATS